MFVRATSPLIWGRDVMAYFILFHILTAFGWVPGDPINGVSSASESGKYGFLAYFIYSFAILIVATQPRKAFAVLTRNALFAGILILAHFSLLWSVDIKAGSMFLVRLDFLTLMILALTTQWGFLGVMTAFGRLGAVLLVVSVLLGFAVPGYALDGFGQLHGVFAHKNTFGAFVAVLGAIWLTQYYFVAKNPWKLAGLALCFVAIILARSATSLLSLFTACSAISCVAIVSAVRREERSIIIGLFLLVTFLIAMAILFAPDAFLHSTLNRDTSMTGRTRVWRLSLDLIQQRPLFGYGYHVIGVQTNHVGAALLQYGKPFTHPHNTWLATGLQLGFVGIFLQLLLYVQLTWAGFKIWWREPRRVEGALVMVVMTGLWIRSIPESDFLLIPSFEYSLLIVLSWSVSALGRPQYYRPSRRLFAMPTPPDVLRQSGVLRQ